VAEGHRAVSVLYQALLTGLVLTLVTRRSEDEAAEFVFRLFRRQHLEKFLPGLAKLGLDRLPPAVACAQYHYLSNQMGGVKTEYAYESDRKAWVRYPPPRWIWYGSAICGIPSRVNAAMLHGWHGHNGVTLGNPRLGFVCTGQTVDGHPGLESDALERLTRRTDGVCRDSRRERQQANQDQQERHYSSHRHVPSIHARGRPRQDRGPSGGSMSRARHVSVAPDQIGPGPDLVQAQRPPERRTARSTAGPYRWSMAALPSSNPPSIAATSR